ncbi:MAG: helix-turn-helix domain-containing protein [Candidatus Tectimicrobiota bacterium]
MSVQPEADGAPQRQFAVILNHLFATRLAPSGRPYTLSEVAKATGLSVPYLSILRKGTIGAISLQRADALARFFRVSLDYFRQEGPPVDTMDALVREALAQPLVREVALRAGKVGTAQRALVLQMLEHADQMVQDLAATPPTSAEARHAPPPEGTRLQQP